MMFYKKNYRAYAKINFGLNVLPKKNTGGGEASEFHNIESVFQTINLHDNLIVKKSKAVGCDVVCDSMVLPKKNTLTNAFDAFCEITGLKNIGVSVFLKKRIPPGGGLGGGSADAAALIRALQNIFNLKLNRSQLDFIASKTGSDVFFFMNCDKNGKGCALVSGRGEIVQKINPRKKLNLLLIFPKQSSSTKEAYDLLDKFYENGAISKSPPFSEFENIYNGSAENWTFINSFTPIISDSCKEIQSAINDLKKARCCFAEMSGSGSTIFGVFTLRRQAIAACNRLSVSWSCKPAQTV